MCEASVYMEKGGVEELVLEGVEIVEDQGDELRLVGIFGEETRLKARIKQFSLVNHRIVLEPLS